MTQVSTKTICFVKINHLAVCSCHVTYAYQGESTLYSCLNVKELLARSRRKIWRLSDCNWTWTQNHLVRKRTLNHLVKLGKMVECSFTNELVLGSSPVAANKPPALTGIRKYNSWSISQLSFAVPADMLKRESFTQTNLVYNGPTLSRDLHLPIRFQVFCDRTINSVYIYVPKYRTKNWLAFTKRQCS